MIIRSVIMHDNNVLVSESIFYILKLLNVIVFLEARDECLEVRSVIFIQKHT